ncbi:hypothetical protein EDD29_1035 [Actinocorallia herbida]|uniref:Uncharacterized protein n=1 Tax=Actinocorallia herbida TaxID=58109 RepID=A0A3N1CQE9_9ACTN|nr:hypothetical protein EDD29_1035 [Actinocorallia herbida]
MTEGIPGTGTFFVGIDVQPGRYRCAEGKGGWWVLFGGPSGDEPSGAWPLEPGPAEVEISPDDFAFETHIPSGWTRVSPPPAERAERARPRPVADPDLRGELDAVVARRGPVARCAPFVLAVLGLGVCLLFQDEQWLLGLPLILMALGARRLLDEVRRDGALRARGDRYLTEDDFDAEAAALLVRTQRAADTVKDALVVRDGLLEELDPALELPRQEWEIAQVLARQARLRRDAVALSTVSGVAEIAALNAALEPQQAKLALSVAAVTRRVEALERYAERTREADAALRACRRLEDLGAHAREYDELLADTVRDELAVPTIDRLTAQSDELLRTLHARLEEASACAVDGFGGGGLGEQPVDGGADLGGHPAGAAVEAGAVPPTVGDPDHAPLDLEDPPRDVR